MSEWTVNLDDLPKGPKGQADEIRDVRGDIVDHARTRDEEAEA